MSQRICRLVERDCQKRPHFVAQESINLLPLSPGDRHPSNIMLDRVTGKFLHIDFGDCFEVAVTRDKFPEKIPFRLTRMLINAMEVRGALSPLHVLL